jgi:hypothetical protein
LIKKSEGCIEAEPRCNAAFHYFAMRPGMDSKPFDADGKTSFGSDITKDYATKSNVK